MKKNAVIPPGIVVAQWYPDDIVISKIGSFVRSDIQEESAGALVCAAVLSELPPEGCISLNLMIEKPLLEVDKIGS